MKTASEVAEEIWNIMGPHPEHLFYVPSEKKADIAHALIDYAKECVGNVLGPNVIHTKEWLDQELERARAEERSYWQDFIRLNYEGRGMDEWYKRGRAEALEECRKLCKCEGLNDVH